MSQARIGKIRMKAGGAEVRVLHRPQGDQSAKIIRHAHVIAKMSEPGSELVGFVTIGLFNDGKTSVGCHYDPKTGVVPRAMLPAFVAEIIRRDLITAAEAEEVACTVVNRANGYEPD